MVHLLGERRNVTICHLMLNLFVILSFIFFLACSFRFEFCPIPPRHFQIKVFGERLSQRSSSKLETLSAINNVDNNNNNNSKNYETIQEFSQA